MLGSGGRIALPMALPQASPDTDGADLVVEAVGSTPAVQTAIAAATRGGTVVLVGNV